MKVHDNPIKPGGFSNDFKDFLAANGYGDLPFARADSPSFGGKTHPGESVSRTPVVLIHGNSDDAAGWADTVNHLLESGYKPSEIYAFSWGPRSVFMGFNQPHDPKYVQQMRSAIEAVLAYTGAEKVDVMGHSQGVTTAMGAIAGVTTDRLGRTRDLGPHLPVETFVGIAGGLRGVTNALSSPLTPSLSLTNGFHPLSRYLQVLRSQPKIADEVYSLTSYSDGVIGRGPPAVYSGQLPMQDGRHVAMWDDHFQIRDRTTHIQRQMLDGEWS